MHINLSIQQRNFLQATLNGIDNYLTLDPASYVKTSLKIASYCTIIFPLIALISREILMRTLGLYEVELPERGAPPLRGLQNDYRPLPPLRSYSEVTDECIESLQGGAAPREALHTWVVQMYKSRNINVTQDRGGNMMDFMGADRGDELLTPAIFEHIERLVPLTEEARALRDRANETGRPFSELIYI